MLLILITNKAIDLFKKGDKLLNMSKTLSMMAKTKIISATKKIYSYLYYTRHTIELTTDQAIIALWLLVRDWRDSYGPEKFDELCDKANDIYDSMNPHIVKELMELQKKSALIEKRMRDEIGL